MIERIKNMFGIKTIEEKYTPAFYTAKDLMLLFQTSRVTLYKLMKDNKIPQPIRLCGHTKRGKLLWKKDEVDNFINNFNGFNELFQASSGR